MNLIARGLEAANVVASRLAPYAKAIVACAGVAVVLAQVVSDGQVSLDEAKELAVAVGVATGVYAVPNKTA